MRRSTYAAGRRGWCPLALCLAVAAALVLETCSAPVVPLQPSGPHPDVALTASLGGSFTPYAPGELWGGGNPAEHCVSCNATALIGQDSAQSIQPGQSVDPANGDFTTSATLLSVPTAAGTFGVSLTYDAQRSISEGTRPSTYPYEDPGPFGWGWQSSLSVSLYNSGPSDQVNEANGSEVDFSDIGTATGDIDADGCPAGAYPDWQKYTVAGSTTAFCAASRVDAQLGTDTSLGTYQFDVSGGSEVDVFNYFGQLVQDGNLQNPDAVSLQYGVKTGTTGCPSTADDKTAACDVETDQVAKGEEITRRIVAESQGFGIVTSVSGPMGTQYVLGYDGDAQLTSIENPTGDVTRYGYATTQPTGYDNEMTSITDPDANTSRVVYATGMVTQLIDPDDQYTVYSYTNPDCATPAGCVGSDTSQTTTVSYGDGETDADYYQGGVLLTNCYGPSTDTCGTGADWGFNYTFATDDGTSTETVNMPGDAQATIVTDAAGNVVAYTDPDGNTTHSMYDDSGYHDLDELCWSAAPGVSVPSDASCTDPPAGATSYTYDSYGDQLSVTDPMGNTTRSGYYDDGQLCWTAPPSVAGGGPCTDGSAPTGAPDGSTAYTYDAESDTTATTVAYGTSSAETTTDSYDEDGRVTDTIPPDGQGHGGFGANPYETVTHYRASGLVQTTVAPLGQVTSYTYDADGHAVTETDPAGVTTTTYDPEGRTCWTYRGTAAVAGATCTPGQPGPSGSTSYTYLATTSAPTAVTDPDGDTTTTTYGDPAYPTEATVTRDPMGTEVTYAVYDDYGQTCISGPVDPETTSCSSPVAGDTWASDDAEGQLLSTFDPSGVTTTDTYGDPDYPTQPTAVTYGSRTTRYAYDADGLETSSTDAQGTVVTTAYDADAEPCWSGPVSSSASCASPPSGTGVTTFAYDPAGQRTQMVDDYGTAKAATDSYSYDADGNLVSATTDNGRTVAYAYDDAAQVTCIAYPVKSGANCADGPSATNTVVDRTYDGAGQLASTTDWLGNTVSYSGYTPEGRVGQVTYPSSTGESLGYHYDADGNLTAADYSGPAVGSAADADTYDPDGQLASATGLDGFSSPQDTYDDYQRVDSATDPTSPTATTTDTYSYNPDGTVASVDPTTGTTETDTYNTLDELTSQSEPTTLGTPTTTLTVGTPIDTGPATDAIAITPNGTKAYVTIDGPQQHALVTPITLSTDTTGTAIRVGTDPDAIAITPNGTKAYVANSGSGTVTPITLSVGTTGTAIRVGTKPKAIAITPSGKTAYVVDAPGGYTKSTVRPITLSTDTTGTAIRVGTDPDAIAITPNGTKAYVANSGSGTVTPITLSAGTTGTAIRVGADPDAIAITPNGTKAYVANSGSGTVTPITLSVGTTGTAIPVGADPDAIAITPNGTKAYVGDSSTVTPITLSTGTTGTAVTVGKDADAIAITSSGTRAYVVTTGSDSVAPITVTTTIPTLTPSYGYTADGQRCWSAPSTGSGPCTSSAPAGATSYGWNGLGQLCWSGATTDATASCTSPPSGTTTYTYDGAGLRMKETPPSGPALTFTWDTVTGDGTPLDIDDGTNAYIYGVGTAPTEQVNLSTGAVSFLASTTSGVQAVFNGSGALQEEAVYTTYGTQVIQSGTKVTPFGFQGTYSTASGLLYLVNRYYTPKTDQFLSVDPDLAETGQPYAFTGDDPLNETDPLGLKGWYCEGGQSHYYQKTKYGLANGKCGAGTTTKYAHYYRESVFATEYYAHHDTEVVSTKIVDGTTMTTITSSEPSTITDTPGPSPSLNCPNTPTAPSAACATHSRQVWYQMQAKTMESGPNLGQISLNWIDGKALGECLGGARDALPAGPVVGTGSWVGIAQATGPEDAPALDTVVALGTGFVAAFGCAFPNNEFPGSG